MKPRRVCLISPGSLASNPRLVKEADALQEAGFQPVVIASGVVDKVRALDESVLAGRAWARDCVRVRPTARELQLPRVLRKGTTLATNALGTTPALAFAQWRVSWLTPALVRAALDVDACLYIAHYLAALPAAFAAGLRHRAPMGFDAEDLHHAELEPTTKAARAEIEARNRIEQYYLPRCVHLTAAAPLIGAAYKARYGVAMETILNVFPLSEAPAEASRQRPADAPLSFYWFSQTIGPGRGLEQIIAALNAMEMPCELHLRGFIEPVYTTLLRGLAGPQLKLAFHKPAPPGEMARLAAEHDLGVCLELGELPHRSVALTNKIFTYLIAGLPMVLSRIPAHDALAPELGEAALVVDFADVAAAGRVLRETVAQPEILARRREAAWRLGRTKFNWDAEKTKFLTLVEHAIEKGTAP